MKKITINIVTGIMLLAMLWSCGGMDETFKEFIKNGEIVYAGTVESVGIYPGKNRVRVSFVVKDPTVIKAKIYWNNKVDSVELDVNATEHPEPYIVDIGNMGENVYSFEFYTYNEEGDASMRVNAVARVYGNEYEKVLLETPVKGAYTIENNPDNFEISWGISDNTVLGNELIYTTKEGLPNTVFISAGETKTVIEGYKQGTDFQYRTFYKPDTMCIDTFYTQLKTQKISGLAIEYNKAGWTAYGEDYDRTNPRKPANAIDNNLSTIWVMDKVTNYPHAMWVDMGQEQLVTGFSFSQNEADKPLNQIELFTSNDGENWITAGEYFLDIKAVQELDLAKEVACRYFKLVVKSDHKKSTFSSLKEIGAYYR